MPPRLDYLVELGQARCAQLIEDHHDIMRVNNLGCWVLPRAGNTDGYVQVYTRRNANLHATGRAAQTAFLLHIVSLVAANGASPVNHCSHLCDNRGCFNPDHLVDGTPAENNARKGCLGDVLCPEHGHVLVSFCRHWPRCIRAPLDAARVTCCRAMRSVALEHTSDPALEHMFASVVDGESGENGVELGVDHVESKRNQFGKHDLKRVMKAVDTPIKSRFDF